MRESALLSLELEALHSFPSELLLQSELRLLPALLAVLKGAGAGAGQDEHCVARALSLLTALVHSLSCSLR